MAQREISESRKAIYYLGIIFIVIGFIVFISSIINFQQQVTNKMNSFDRSPFGLLEKKRSNNIPSMTGPFIGFFIIAIGGVMINIGKKGLAGSGIILSPEGERKDLEPWNRSKGRQVQDALEETQLDEILLSGNSQKVLIKVRCPECDHLNDEEDKYCGNCGAKLIKDA